MDALPEVMQPVIESPLGPRGLAPLIRKLHLKYPELSESDIARQVGCDPSNVHRVLKRFLGDAISDEEHEDFRQNTADVFEQMQHRILRSISDADIAKAPLLPRITAMAILEDKKRTIRGQATSINVTQIWDAVAAIREMREE